MALSFRGAARARVLLGFLSWPRSGLGRIVMTPPVAEGVAKTTGPGSRRFSLTPPLLSLIDADNDVTPNCQTFNLGRSLKLDRPRAIYVRTTAACSGHADGVYGACTRVPASSSAPATRAYAHRSACGRRLVRG